jgi:AAA domain
VSIRFRLNSIELATDGGPVKHSFSGPLTVLTGPVGVGKSTLFELIKHALGGTARIAPVARDHITHVKVELEIADQTLRLSRWITGPKSGQVEIHDVLADNALGSFPVSPDKGGDASGTASSALLTAMGLPTDVVATSKTRTARITFNNVWSFIYVEQREIDRSVARNNDSYLEPGRKTTFELLFGLTDSTVLKLREQVLQSQNTLNLALTEERAVMSFLADSRVRTQHDAVAAAQAAERDRAVAEAQLASLQSDADAVRGQVGVVRDLLLQAREQLSELQSQQREVDIASDEQMRMLRQLRDRAAEAERGKQASEILAPIEFVICPRCAQSITDRAHDDGTCRLCLQPEPKLDSLDQPTSTETERVTSQIHEVETLLTFTTLERSSVESRVAVARDDLMKLEALLDARTREFVSPRLEQYADAAAALARSDEVLSAMEGVLRQWDRANDLKLSRVTAEEALAQAKSSLKVASDSLASVRSELLESLSAGYQEMVARLGVPTVERAYIDSKNYLPFANGDRFDRISTGGITTALVTAYWLTVLATALRERQTKYPTLLIIDTPRKSIGAQNAQMADELYRQLDTLASAYGNRMQVIIADNDIPKDISKRWQDLRFDYEHPTVPSVPHPGPAGVTPLDVDEA